MVMRTGSCRGRDLWLAAAMALVVVGCEPTPSEEPRPERDREVAVIEVAEEVERPWRGPRPASFDGWPGASDGGAGFELMWLGGEDYVELKVESLEDAPVVTAASFEDGDTIDWRQTRVVVLEPRLVRLIEDWDMWGLRYDLEEGEVSEHEVEESYEEGAKLEIYHQALGGECYMSHDHELVLAQCPPIEKVQAVAADGEPLEEEVVLDGRRKQWWVLVEWEDERGWFKVEEAPVDVRERRMERFDPTGEPGFEDYY